MNYAETENTRHYFISNPDAVFLLNPECIILDINESAIENSLSAFGIAARIGDNFLDFIGHSLKKSFLDNFRKALTGEKIKIQSIVPGTNEVYLETYSLLPLEGSDGSVKGVIYQKSLVQEPIPKENNISQAVGRLELILKGANVGWWDMDLETGANFYDPKWWAMIGYEPGELPVTADLRSKIYHPNDLDIINNKLDTAISSRQSNYEMEYRLIHKSGHFIPVLCRGYILRNENGKAIRISGINMDLTERKIADENHQKSENYLRTIFQNTELGYIFLDVNLNILSFNQKAQQITQTLNDKAISIGGNVLDFVREERLQHFNDYLEDAFEGQKIEYERCIVNDKKDEEWFYLKLSPVFDLSNTVVNVIMLLENISERKRSEIQLNKSFDLVSAQNKRLLNFSYIVSHNLRSHASNIISIVDFLNEADSDEERNEMITHLKTVSTSLDDTLRNLNDVISIHTSINLIFEPLILNAFIKKAIDVLSDQVYRKDATIINHVSNDLVVNYNPAYIESIILNFLSNALKYSHPDRKPVITIDCRPDNGKFILLFMDNGIGIDLKKNGEKLFGLYKTFNGNTDARGIGLFITKNQVEYMGGKIEVESELGTGTTFKIYI